MKQNTNYSREWFFELCKIKNHAVTVTFIPGSSAYRNYGPHMTIDVILSDDEMEEMIKHYKDKVNTGGVIKAKILVTDNFTSQQVESAKTVGFDTSDVFETIHV